MTADLDPAVRAIVAAAANPLLAWNTPLSTAHADELVEACAVPPGGRVVDLGCGWGTLLVRMIAAAPGSTGDGVDTDQVALDRGVAVAGAAGLAERVRFHARPADQWPGTGYDVAICVGSGHAWAGGTPAALAALRSCVRPGGAVLFADGFWTGPPSPAALGGLGAEPGELGTLDELVDTALASGLRLLRLSVADEREWDVFESTWCAGGERWALANPGHPLRPAVLAAVDVHRQGWLRGYRGQLGFAYLVLARS